MAEPFEDMLKEGGKSNSLGRASEVVQLVLHDQNRLEELYGCLSADDPWVRMRAFDSLEKICRSKPAWLLPFIDQLISDFSTHPQASVQWHLAQIYGHASLTPKQKQSAIDWLQARIITVDVDWIVAANAMDTLMKFTQDGSFPEEEMISLLKTQLEHKSQAVRKRASKFLQNLATTKH